MFKHKKSRISLACAALLSVGAAQAQIDEIIVTANKREQTLQEVPISVSVTSAETIQQSSIVDLIDLQTAVPALRVNQLQSSAQTNFVIRGFGNGANNPGIEPAVLVLIDGVPRSRSDRCRSPRPPPRWRRGSFPPGRSGSIRSRRRRASPRGVRLDP